MVWYKPWTWSFFQPTSFVTIDENAPQRTTKRFTVDPTADTVVNGVDSNAVHYEVVHLDHGDNWIEFYLHNMWECTGDEARFVYLLCTTDVHETVHEFSDEEHDPESVAWDQTIAECTFPDENFRIVSR